MVIGVSRQVSHHSSGSFNVCDMLTVYLTFHTLTTSWEFRWVPRLGPEDWLKWLLNILIMFHSINWMFKKRKKVPFSISSNSELKSRSCRRLHHRRFGDYFENYICFSNGVIQWPVNGEIKLTWLWRIERLANTRRTSSQVLCLCLPEQKKIRLSFDEAKGSASPVQKTTTTTKEE